MDADFWLQRGNQGRIGFHRGEVMPLLEKHWATLDVAAHGRVFVPLAGKSLDMHWLAAQGHEVLGVELSPLAVRAFFADAGLRPAIHADAEGVHHRAGPVCKPGRGENLRRSKAPSKAQGLMCFVFSDFLRGSVCDRL